MRLIKPVMTAIILSIVSMAAIMTAAAYDKMDENPLSGDRYRIIFIDGDMNILYVNEDLVYGQEIYVLGANGEKLHEYVVRHNTNIELPAIPGEFKMWTGYYRSNIFYLEPVFYHVLGIYNENGQILRRVVCDDGFYIKAYTENIRGEDIDIFESVYYGSEKIILPKPKEYNYTVHPVYDYYEFEGWEIRNETWGSLEIVATYKHVHYEVIEEPEPEKPAYIIELVGYDVHMAIIIGGGALLLAIMTAIIIFTVKTLKKNKQKPQNKEAKQSKGSIEPIDVSEFVNKRTDAEETAIKTEETDEEIDGIKFYHRDLSKEEAEMVKKLLDKEDVISEIFEQDSGKYRLSYIGDYSQEIYKALAQFNKELGK